MFVAHFESVQNVLWFIIFSAFPLLNAYKGQTCLEHMLVLGKYMPCLICWGVALVCFLLLWKVTKGDGGGTQIACTMRTLLQYCFTMKGIAISSLCWGVQFQSCFRKFGATFICLKHWQHCAINTAVCFLLLLHSDNSSEEDETNQHPSEITVL